MTNYRARTLIVRYLNCGRLMLLVGDQGDVFIQPNPDTFFSFSDDEISLAGLERIHEALGVHIRRRKAS